MNFNKPKILVIDANLHFDEVLSETYKYFDIEVVQKPSEGLQVAYQGDIDVILLDLDTELHNPFELSMQFKQSMITRDIPIIVISNDESLQMRINTFRFGGVDYLSKESSTAQFVSKITHHVNAYKRAKDYQYLDAQKNITPKYQLDLRLKKLQRRNVENEQLSLLLFDVDTSQVTISLADACDISKEMCSGTLHSIINRIIKRENDSVVKLSDTKFAVVLPNTDLQGALSVADQINETFFFTTNSPTSKINFPSNALKVGITTVNHLFNNSHQNILESAEAALEDAKRSNEFFCIN